MHQADGPKEVYKKKWILEPPRPLSKITLSLSSVVKFWPSTFHFYFVQTSCHRSPKTPMVSHMLPSVPLPLQAVFICTVPLSRVGRRSNMNRCFGFQARQFMTGRLPSAAACRSARLGSVGIPPILMLHRTAWHAPQNGRLTMRVRAMKERCLTSAWNCRG